jgi:prepilin-type N-terminal cleavage/methylation domain-containing protein
MRETRVRKTSLSQQQTRQAGFTMVELLVSMAVFLIISAAAFRLFSMQQSAEETTQGQVGMNLALRNAVSMLQMDVSNAGSGYFQAANVPSWPVGVTIVNNVVAPGQSCYNGNVYGPNCFDRINIITAAAAAPALNCSSTDTGIANTQVATIPGSTLASTAALFKRADQILFVNSTGSKISTAILTADATVSGAGVKLTFNSTDGFGGNTSANDPLALTTCSGNSCTELRKRLTNQFCGGDWILKLAPISYWVDTATDPANPRLMRTQTGVSNIVMEQIIGFKIGASIFNTTKDITVPQFSSDYNYNTNSYYKDAAGDNLLANNFTVVRSVRMSIIARTAPNTSNAYKFRNGFDRGPYQVQGVAVVVNPRNMSMND